MTYVPLDDLKPGDKIRLPPPLTLLMAKHIAGEVVELLEADNKMQFITIRPWKVRNSDGEEHMVYLSILHTRRVELISRKE